MINLLEITEECKSMLGVIYFIRELIEIACFIIPIVLIVMLSIDIAKGVIAGDEKASKTIGIVSKRLIYAIVIFILPDTIFGAFNIVLDSQTDESYSCWKYAGEVSMKQLNIIVRDQEEALDKQLERMREEDAQAAREKLVASNNFKNTVLTAANKSNIASADGTYLGQTYHLTDAELRGIARLCQQEQGSAEGAAAEASLILNRFELHPNPDYPNLFGYVKNAGWWSHASSYLNNPTGLKQEILDAVKEVIVHGKRTLPLYVDEHDCIYCGNGRYDIISATNNGIQFDVDDRDQYKQDVTILENRYDSTYTFHSFPTEKSDPFGYTEEAMRKYKELQGES